MLSGEFFVEVRRVKGIGHIGLKRRLILALKKFSPVDAMEEGVCFDFGCSVGT